MTSALAGVSGSGWTPFMRMQDQLQSAVKSGTVKTEDQDALSAALTDIGTQLQASASGSTGTPPAPGSMKSKIDGLIAGEVSSGKLTSDQASELKSVFAQAAQKMHGHHHRTAGSGDGDGDGDDASQATPVAATGFIDFLKKLETALTESVNAVTGTSGSTDTTSAQATSTGTSSSATQAANDPRQLMLSFLKKLETSLGGGNTYGATGSNGSASAQAVLVNAMA